MRKSIALCFLTVVLLFLVSCSATIPGSSEAKEKLEGLGYQVSMSTSAGADAEDIGITQVTQLDASKDGEIVLQVYFFANEEDTETFYNRYEKSLNLEVENCRKNRYSIWRGQQKAVDDLLK